MKLIYLAVSVLPRRLSCLAFWLVLFGCSSQPTAISQADKLNADHAALGPESSDKTDSTSIQKAELTEIYSQAIGDFIRLVHKEYDLSFDTLFFGKHVVGQPDDFPDILLPDTIAQTTIRLVSPALGEKKQKENKSPFYINMVGWVSDDDAAFIFVTFSNGMAHQFDGFVNYGYDRSKKGYVMENSRFENHLYKKK